MFDGKAFHSLAVVRKKLFPNVLDECLISAVFPDVKGKFFPTNNMKLWKIITMEIEVN